MSISPKITADQIAQWATRPNAQFELPELLRRLIYASGATVHSLSAPSDKDVFLGGYDIQLNTTSAGHHIPIGASVWEVSVREDVINKLREDYQKRTNEPAGVDPAQTTYIAVTGRKWPQNSTKYPDPETWARQKLEDKVWQDILVLDAGALAGWLEQAPAVASWFARTLLVGEPAADVHDAEHYLLTQQRLHTPPEDVTPQHQSLGRLVCTDREAEVQQVQQWALGAPNQFPLLAETSEEAAWFACAALVMEPWIHQDALRARTLVITSAAAWAHYTQEGALPDGAVLIAAFPEARLTTGLRHVHTCLPQPNDGTAQGITLRPIARDRLAAGLTRWLGVTPDRANDAAHGGGRSLMAALRLLSFSVPLPAWRDARDVQRLIPALLVGQWSIERSGGQARYRDAEVFTMFPGLGSLDVLMEGVIPAIFGADSPIEEVPGWRSSSALRWRGREDAWRFLRGRIRHLESSWASVCDEVFSTTDAGFDLPVNKRIYTTLRSDLSRGFSNTLRGGLAQGLTLYAREGAHEARFVEERVQRALATTDWRRWATLDSSLSALAEAAPAAFLDAVSALVHADDQIAQLCEVSEGFGARHDLIQALTLVAWWPEHTQRAVRALAALVPHAPEPAQALEAIFNPWMPQTTMSVAGREELLTRLSTREPELVWSICIHWLRRTRGGLLHRHERPVEFVEVDERATNQEVTEAFARIVTDVLAQAGTDGARWRALMEELNHFWRTGQGDAFVSALRERAEALCQDAAFMWAWRVALNRHYGYRRRRNDETLPDATFWDALLALYQAHEPSEDVQRRWLFEHHRLAHPEGDLSWREEDERRLRLRNEAVRTLWESGELEAFVLGLDVSDVGGEELTATSLALVIDDAEVEEALGLHIPAARAESFWARFFWPLGSRAVEHNKLFEWFERMLALINEQEEARREPMMVGLLRRLPINEETFKYLDEPERDALRVRYWQLVPLGWQDAPPVEVVLRACVSCLDAGRLGDVLEYLNTHNEEWLRWSEQSRADVLDLFRRVMDEAIAGGGATLSEHSWNLKELHGYVFRAGHYDPEWLAHWEFLAFGVLREIGMTGDGGGPHWAYLELFRQLESDPAFFVELLSYWTRGDDTTDEVSEHQQTLATRAFEVFMYWKTRPGRGGITLVEWVERALSSAAETGRAEIAASKIGEALANGGSGEDGVWPDQEVRAVLEAHDSNDVLHRGFAVGVANRHGSSVRGYGDGGQRERALEATYRGWTEALEWDWPVTAGLLRQVADDFGRDAAREDERAAFEELNQRYHASQEGYFNRKQADAVGLGPLLAELIEAQKIERVYGDVYRIKELSGANLRGDARVGALLAVWLWADKAGVFCGETALDLHDLCDILPRKIFLLLPKSWEARQLTPPEGVELSFDDVPPTTQQVWIDGRLPITGVAQTLNDCAAQGVEDPGILLQAIKKAKRKGLVRDEQIRAALDYVAMFEQEAS